MTNPSALFAFGLAALALAVVPGPAVMYIVTRSVHQGRAAGLASVTGVALGGLVHVMAAAAGISAVFARSAGLFTVVKLAGAGYLIWLGVTRIIRPAGPPEDGYPSTPTSSVSPDAKRVFWDGFLVNVLNPKTALFFLAFLPQFVVLDGWPTGVQAGLLGALFVTIALVTDSLYALAASAVRQSMRGGRFGPAVVRRASGTIYIALGLYAAFTGRHASGA